ncbi:MAG: peptidase MA family metallohydrolase [Thermodesulfovibrionales bacterium]|nr:peptidase MA family metallohydrolase [Thermodesulfovibrionales bacterium]
MKILLALFLLFSWVHFLFADETRSLQTNEVEVLYLESQNRISQEVAALYPIVRYELELDFGWTIDFRPVVVLADNTERFRSMTGSDVVIALADPGRNLIVLDTARVYTKPFTLKTTLKHEVCHLLLHRHIESGNLPRWLDEGVCQWASGGISELMAEPGGRGLANAVISGRLITIRALESFPQDDRNLVLAYEESKSFIEFIESTFGKEGIVSLLRHLKERRPIDESIQGALDLSMFELESRWHASLKTKYTWVSYLSSHLYTILFVFATFVMVYGFFRFLKRKKAYVDEEESDESRNQEL